MPGQEQLHLLPQHTLYHLLLLLPLRRHCQLRSPGPVLRVLLLRPQRYLHHQQPGPDSAIHGPVWHRVPALLRGRQRRGLGIQREQQQHLQVRHREHLSRPLLPRRHHPHLRQRGRARQHLQGELHPQQPLRLQRLYQGLFGEVLLLCQLLLLHHGLHPDRQGDHQQGLPQRNLPRLHLHHPDLTQHRGHGAPLYPGPGRQRTGHHRVQREEQPLLQGHPCGRQHPGLLHPNLHRLCLRRYGPVQGHGVQPGRQHLHGHEPGILRGRLISPHLCLQAGSEPDPGGAEGRRLRQLLLHPAQRQARRGPVLDHGGPLLRPQGAGRSQQHPVGVLPCLACAGRRVCDSGRGPGRHGGRRR